MMARITPASSFLMVPPRRAQSPTPTVERLRFVDSERGPFQQYARPSMASRKARGGLHETIAYTLRHGPVFRIDLTVYSRDTGRRTATRGGDHEEAVCHRDVS